MNKVSRQPRENRVNLIRLSVGFTVSAGACAIPWVALTSVILPAVLEDINAAGKESMLGTINAVGSVVALLANVIFGTFSDLTRSRFGKRTPWIIIGGLIAGGAMALLALNQHSFPMILLLWCMAQLGYNVMLAPFVATMSDRGPRNDFGLLWGRNRGRSNHRQSGWSPPSQGGQWAHSRLAPGRGSLCRYRYRHRDHLASRRG